jgi:hypothetical protein
VMDGELETTRGVVANQLMGTRIRLLEYERKLKEIEELEERPEAPERAHRQEGGKPNGSCPREFPTMRNGACYS